MLPWTQRPPEAHLFNPAYCALLLRQAVEGYQKTAQETCCNRIPIRARVTATAGAAGNTPCTSCRNTP